MKVQQAGHMPYGADVRTFGPFMLSLVNMPHGRQFIVGVKLDLFGWSLATNIVLIRWKP